MRSQHAVLTAVVAVVLAACAGSASDDSDTGDAPSVDGATVELTDADGWTWTVELAGVSTDPDLGDDPAPPGETYVDVEVAITNELADRRAGLPSFTEVFAYVDDPGAVDECLAPLQEPMGRTDAVDGCLVAWDGAWTGMVDERGMHLDYSLDARAPGGPPGELAPGERARFSLGGLNAVEEGAAHDVGVGVAWPAGDTMSAEITGDAAIQRGEDHDWVVLSAP